MYSILLKLLVSAYDLYWFSYCYHYLSVLIQLSISFCVHTALSALLLTLKYTQYVVIHYPAFPHSKTKESRSFRNQN